MRHTLLRLLKRAAQQTHIIAHVISSSSREEEEEAPAERAALDIYPEDMRACGTRPRGCVITSPPTTTNTSKSIQTQQSSKTTYVVSTAANIYSFLVLHNCLTK